MSAAGHSGKGRPPKPPLIDPGDLRKIARRAAGTSRAIRGYAASPRVTPRGAAATPSLKAG